MCGLMLGVYLEPEEPSQGIWKVAGIGFGVITDDVLSKAIDPIMTVHHHFICG